MSRYVRPARSVAQEALIAVVRAADRVKREVAQVIEPHGVTLQQYNVLRILRGAGPEGLPTLEVGARMMEQAPGVTRLVERLVRKQLVARARGDEDARQVICRITPKGLALLALMDQPVLEADTAAVSALSRMEQLRLTALLRKLEGMR
jgi:DNA-binding MarR family transcriptional regulator